MTPTDERSQTPNGGNVGTTTQDSRATVAELRKIVTEAYVYGFPMVDSYRIQYSYFVDRTNPEFKGAWNQPHSVARVYTPQDKTIQTPNSDTPYTFLGADLRAEPLVISVPAIPKDRYYSLQFIDMYTHNFAYVGSRATGSDAGYYLLAGPASMLQTTTGVEAPRAATFTRRPVCVKEAIHLESGEKKGRTPSESGINSASRPGDARSRRYMR